MWGKIILLWTNVQTWLNLVLVKAHLWQRLSIMGHVCWLLYSGQNLEVNIGWVISWCSIRLLGEPYIFWENKHWEKWPTNYSHNLKMIKIFCVWISPISFLHISLIYLVSTYISDIKNIMFLLYYIPMTWLCH